MTTATPTTTPTTTSATSATLLAPYLCVHDAAGAIDFYVQVFGATESSRLVGPDGRIGHAELDIAGSTLMLADEYPEAGALGPRSIGGSPVLMNLRVPDVDQVVARAIDAGAVLVQPVEDQFYGERSGTIIDPFGHTWMVRSHVEDVSPDEVTRRWVESERAREGDES